MPGVPVTLSHVAQDCFGATLSHLDSTLPILLSTKAGDDCLVGYGQPPSVVSTIVNGYLNFSLQFRRPPVTTPDRLCNLTMVALSAIEVMPSVSFIAKPCGPGLYVLATDGICVTCPPLTYSFRSNSEVCYACPSNALCPTPSTVVSTDDHWIGNASSNIYQRVAYRCLPGYCLENNECRPHSAPIESNPLCGSCAPGYVSLIGECACMLKFGFSLPAIHNVFPDHYGNL
jgi:hypothetical protein